MSRVKPKFMICEKLHNRQQLKRLCEKMRIDGSIGKLRIAVPHFKPKDLTNILHGLKSLHYENSSNDIPLRFHNGYK